MAAATGEAQADAGGKRDRKEGGCWRGRRRPGKAEESGKSKDSGSGSRASGREMLKDEAPRSVEAARSLGLAEPRCRLSGAARSLGRRAHRRP